MSAPGNTGIAGATRRARARALALLHLNPQVEELVSALGEAGQLSCPGELSEKLVTYVALAMPEAFSHLAEGIRQDGPDIHIEAHMAWAIGNRKVAWDQKGQWS